MISMLAPSPQSLRSMALSTRSLCSDARRQMQMRTRFRRLTTSDWRVVSRLPNGRRDGYDVCLYPGRTCCERRYYVNDTKYGVLLRWYQNGVLSKRYTYAHGALDGVCETWHQNAAQNELCFYKAGWLFGDYKKWTPDGQFARHSIYDDTHIGTIIYRRAS